MFSLLFNNWKTSEPSERRVDLPVGSQKMEVNDNCIFEEEAE